MESLFSLEYLIQQLNTKPIAGNTRSSIEKFLEILDKPKINLNELKKLSNQGVPDDIKGLRSLVWKLLLGYLPADRTKWNSTIKTNIEIYEQFCNDLIKSKLQKQMTESNEYEDQELQQSKKQDHPLSKSLQSIWKSFFDDQVIWEEVEKDTVRTRAELSFFVSPTQIPNKYPVYFRTQCRRERRLAKDYEHRHYDVLTRILFIYAKLNPAIRYVQGMNELLAPLYYVFYSDTNELFLQSVESDAFFCFTILMSDAKDSFLRALDDSQDGIKSKMNNLNTLLRIHEIEIWDNLQKQGIHPQFYSLRWIMLYLTQEFELHSVFILWDSLLSHSNKNEYLLFLCLSIIKELKPSLLQDDFTDIMEGLQQVGKIQVERILQITSQIYQHN
ncbi:unnamed protein product (macronuclear) [Paramecium tetraurelia]|uniref:Rab-GAP TBC domain-containing protein n=1 Tax=Paramecium tetraurelia TaxID=5888 RepID=A0BQ73_PARTE|nr:uncharacterized protein GSPATT00005441001 [Paramecium tetraurelia]CAK60690.1 unnamed protein product [Paramecium tetraurelia]|eukprot:XP_001428088.1 hypothetical protein (macronuclear) [Paramecium tetraurelia strain d4-2]